MNFCMTGATSFSGYWFVRQLILDGHELTIVRSRDNNFESTENPWLKKLKEESLSFREISFAQEMTTKLNFDALLLHGSFMENRRSPNFNVNLAVQKTLGVTKWIKENSKTNHVIHTGTFSEEDEGVGESPLNNFNPYSKSKTLIYKEHQEIFRGVPFLKFTMPNPFGRFQQNNLFSFLEKAWTKNDIPLISQPNYIRDYVPVDLLAISYSNIIGSFIAGKHPLEYFSPSYFVMSNRDMSKLYASEISSRIGQNLEIQFGEQNDYAESRVRINKDSLHQLIENWSLEEFWDSVATDYIGGNDATN